YPYEPGDPHGIAQVIRTGEALLYSEITAELLQSRARDEEHLRLLNLVGLRSAMMVPIGSARGVVGVITFISTSESDRRYDDTDLAVATELAGRAAVAIENARLYQAAQSGEATLRLALRAARMDTWSYDPTTRRVSWSGNLESMYGLKPGTFDGTLRSLARGIYPPDRVKTVRAIMRAVAQRAELSIEFRTLTAAGQLKWVVGHGSPFTDTDTGTTRLVGIAFDATEMRQAGEAQERLAAIVASSADAIVSTDLTGIVTSWNAAAEVIYGYTAEEMIGQSKSKVMPPDSPHEFLETLEAIAAGRTVKHFDTLRLHKDGRLFHASVTASPVRNRDGEIVGASTVVRDISERKQTEQEIRALNTRLQRAISETHHRVKNNLQVVAALLNMQVMNYPTAVPVDEVAKSMQHVVSLAAIHDLLTQQTNASGHATEVPVAAVLGKLTDALKSVSGQRRIVADLPEFQIPAQVCASLAILINELVTNSLKHGAGDVTISMEQTESGARLCVADEGPGFPDGFDPARHSSTGLQIVESVATWDLHGTVRYGEALKSRVVVEFPLTRSDG
ncbi:MAG TPA: PAS domain S-box protein, partial [Chthonomonadales bacterium]|nr:PAS domain S-box protein [Chthonomonadales bacterium]